MARYWSCRRCGTRNERGTSRRCLGCGNATKPKARVPDHAKTLRDDTYEVYNRINAEIHGVTDESCAVCGKPRSFHRRHDRDHGHDRRENSYGKPRGLACGGEWGCNKLMARLTRERVQAILAYLERVEAYYSREAA